MILAAAAAFFLRKPVSVAVLPEAAPVRPGQAYAGTNAMGAPVAPRATYAPASAATVFAAPVSHNQQLLGILKEELFAIESEKIAGKLSPEAYVELKSAFEIVLRRALGIQ